MATCTAHAKYFGDLEDRGSEVSRLVFRGRRPADGDPDGRRGPECLLSRAAGAPRPGPEQLPAPAAAPSHRWRGVDEAPEAARARRRGPDLRRVRPWRSSRSSARGRATLRSDAIPLDARAAHLGAGRGDAPAADQEAPRRHHPPALVQRDHLDPRGRDRSGADLLAPLSRRPGVVPRDRQRPLRHAGQSPALPRRPRPRLDRRLPGLRDLRLPHVPPRRGSEEGDRTRPGRRALALRPRAPDSRAQATRRCRCRASTTPDRSSSRWSCTRCCRS